MFRGPNDRVRVPATCIILCYMPTCELRPDNDHQIIIISFSTMIYPLSHHHHYYYYIIINIVVVITNRKHYVLLRVRVILFRTIRRRFGHCSPTRYNGGVAPVYARDLRNFVTTEPSTRGYISCSGRPRSGQHVFVKTKKKTTKSDRKFPETMVVRVLISLKLFSLYIIERYKN